MTEFKAYIGPPDNCTVCAMPLVGKAHVVAKEVAGDVYAFCSPECFKKFEEDPDAYLNGDEDEEE